MPGLRWTPLRTQAPFGSSQPLPVPRSRRGVESTRGGAVARGIPRPPRFTRRRGVVGRVGHGPRSGADAVPLLTVHRAKGLGVGHRVPPGAGTRRVPVAGDPVRGSGLGALRRSIPPPARPRRPSLARRRRRPAQGRAQGRPRRSGVAHRIRRRDQGSSFHLRFGRFLDRRRQAAESEPTVRDHRRGCQPGRSAVR